MAKLRFALIGCSKIARKHAASLSRLDDAELVAVCDLNEETARALGDEYGVPHYQSYDKMLAAESIDVITVLTPSGDHARRVLDLVRFGKHLIVEKPLALRLDDADAVIRACDIAGSKLFDVKQNRYNRPAQALRMALDQGRFGKLVMGSVRVRWCRRQEYYDSAPWRGTWAMDGGVLTNQASHHLDMLEWMMGDVDTVTAMTATRLADMEAEDTAVAVLRFRNGALGSIEATTATRPKDLEGSLTVMGENGCVEIGGFSMDQLRIWQFEKERPEDAEIFETHGKNPEIFAWNHGEYLAGVVDAIRAHRAGLVDGMEGRRSLELINALYESSETGLAVPLRFTPKECRLGVTSHD
jgi:UDP-N-acetyl-2-amino-2-deoxyglucuronate dehydrogenase